jgi:CRP/FNR family transcriptional regulator, cyclic AMP receptor protein
VPLFEACSKRELGEVAAAADELDVGPGTVLTREGAAGREFVVIAEGTADVTRDGRKINKPGSGDFLGEIALVSGRRRTATVTTTSSVRMLVLTGRAFQRLLEQWPGIRLKVVEALADRLSADAV